MGHHACLSIFVKLSLKNTVHQHKHYLEKPFQISPAVNCDIASNVNAHHNILAAALHVRTPRVLYFDGEQAKCHVNVL